MRHGLRKTNTLATNWHTSNTRKTQHTICSIDLKLSNLNSIGTDVVTPPAAGGALPRPDALFTPEECNNRQNGPAFSSFVSNSFSTNFKGQILWWNRLRIDFVYL